MCALATTPALLFTPFLSLVSWILPETLNEQFALGACALFRACRRTMLGDYDPPYRAYAMEDYHAYVGSWPSCRTN